MGECRGKQPRTRVRSGHQDQPGATGAEDRWLHWGVRHRAGDKGSALWVVWSHRR